MNTTLRSAILAFLAVCGLAVGAASFDATMGGGDATAVGTAPENRSAGGVPDPGEPPRERQPLDVPFVEPVVTALAGIVVLVTAVILIRNRRFVAIWALSTVAGIAVLLSLPAGGTAPKFGPVGDGSEPTSSLSVLALGVGVVLFGVVVTLLGGEDTGDDSAVSDSESDATAVGRAAGRAADRLEAGVDVDNGVYRAWREMTGPLDVDRPESSTHGEFADAAVAAGLERSEVRELTRLFEAVRYGDRQATAKTEERAVALFRRIEDGYADASTAGDPAEGAREAAASESTDTAGDPGDTGGDTTSDANTRAPREEGESGATDEASSESEESSTDDTGPTESGRDAG